MTSRTPNPKATALLLVCAVHIFAQTAHKPSPQQTVTVVVVNAHAQPATPVPAVRVSLSYVDNGARVTEAVKPTSSNGEAYLLVSSDAPQRGDLRIEISGVNDLVIYEPADGQLTCPKDQTDQSKCPYVQMTALPSRITILLLPKGSLALLGPAQIEALQRRLSQHVNSLQAQTTKQQNEIKGLQSQLQAAQQQAADQRASIDEGLEEWARTNGLDLDDAKKMIQQWAQSIQSQPGASAEQKALAAFALKDYATAATDFGEAEDAEKAALDDQRKQQQEQNRAALSKLLQTTTQRANALQLVARYHDATVAYVRTRDYIAAQQATAPEDKDLHIIWMESIEEAAIARCDEAEISTPADSLALLVQSRTDIEGLIKQYRSVGDRPGIATAQGELGGVLEAEAERSGETAISLFDLSLQMYTDALSILTEDEDPREGARMQANLGNALESEAERVSGEQAFSLLDKAVSAHKLALGVFLKVGETQDAALVRANLGTTFTEKGKRTAGEDGDAALAVAVQNYLEALAVFDKDGPIQIRATTLTDLGITYLNQARRSKDEKAAQLLDKAERAFKQGLDLVDRDMSPQIWAKVQANLANAFTEKAIQTSGTDAVMDAQEAAANYSEILKVIKKTELPQMWGRAQIGLGFALLTEAVKANGPISPTLLEKAEQADQHALEVFTRESFPEDWARAQNNLSDIHVSQRRYEAAIAEKEALLEMYPTDSNLLTDTAELYHDRLFRYDRALEANERIVKIYPSGFNRLKYIEAALTSAHFDLCLQLVGGVVDALHTPQGILFRDSFKLACQWGAGEKSLSLETEKGLLSKTTALEQEPWDFTGTLHYLSISAAFANGRASWIALFTSIQNGDAPGMTTALHQLEPLMQK